MVLSRGEGGVRQRLEMFLVVTTGGGQDGLAAVLPESPRSGMLPHAQDGPPAQSHLVPNVSSARLTKRTLQRMLRP